LARLLTMWSLGQEGPYLGSRDRLHWQRCEIDIHLVIGIALVMNSSGTLTMRIAFASSFVRKALTMRSLMPGSLRRSSGRFNTSRTSRIIGSLTKSDTSPLKTAAVLFALGCYGWRFLERRDCSQRRRGE
jgi:hypothetical protein